VNSHTELYGSGKSAKMRKFRSFNASKCPLSPKLIGWGRALCSLVVKLPAIFSLKVFLYLWISRPLGDDPFTPVSGLAFCQSCSRSPEFCCPAAISIPSIPRRRYQRRHHNIDRVHPKNRLALMLWSLMARLDTIMGVSGGQR
jgi:hypothetical protein